MTKATKEEYNFQKEDKKGYKTGYLVKLFSPEMSSLSIEEERTIHTYWYHRIWMYDEVIKLSDIELAKLIKKWT